MALFGPNVEKLKAKGDIKGLIKLLNYTKDERVLFSAMQALVDIGEPAVEPLIAALDDYGLFAVPPLVDIGQPAVGPLTAVVENKDISELVRMYANQALEKIQEA